MGLHSKLKALWRMVFAPAAFMDSSSPAVRGAQGDTRVSLCDYLTRYMPLDRDRLWTLQELSAKLCASVSHRAQTTLLSCDDKRYVPKLKAEEQEDRAEGRAKTATSKGKEEAKPYPADAHWTEHGIAWTEEGEEVEDGIDLSRLGMSRWYGSPTDPKRCSNLGNTMWYDMHADLQEHLRSRGARATEVVFHHDAKLGPVRFMTSQDYETGEWNTMRQENMFTPRPLGEADTDILRWTADYDGKVDHIDWDTCDSDLIALYCLYHSRRTPEQKGRTRVWWNCEHGVSVDLAMLVELTLRHEVLCADDMRRRFTSPEAIGLFMIFCGTDFIKHKCYAHGCGEDKMLSAFLHEELVVTRDTPIGPIFERWLRRLHFHKLFKVVNVPAHMRKPPTPLASIDSIRDKYVKDAPRLAKARKARQEKAMAKFKAEWQLKMAPVRARQEDPMELESATEVLTDMQREYADELEKLEAKHAEPPWKFPTPEELDWYTRVLQWVFDYWKGASQGIVPKEPVRNVEDAPMAVAPSPTKKRTSPHFAPAAMEAASSVQKKAKVANVCWAGYHGCEETQLPGGTRLCDMCREYVGDSIMCGQDACIDLVDPDEYKNGHRGLHYCLQCFEYDKKGVAHKKAAPAAAAASNSSSKPIEFELSDSDWDFE